MNLDRVPTGMNAPHEFKIILENPAHPEPIKYEVVTSIHNFQAVPDKPHF